jgi:hypothetical protein
VGYWYLIMPFAKYRSLLLTLDNVFLEALDWTFYKLDSKDKRKITKKFKTLVHLPRSLQRSVRHRRRTRFPIVAGHQSQSPQVGGRRGGLTSRRISRVHCLPGASANSDIHDTSSIPPPATRAKLRFLQKNTFLEINRVNNIIT